MVHTHLEALLQGQRDMHLQTPGCQELRRLRLQQQHQQLPHPPRQPFQDRWHLLKYLQRLVGWEEEERGFSAQGACCAADRPMLLPTCLGPQTPGPGQQVPAARLTC